MIEIEEKSFLKELKENLKKDGMIGLSFLGEETNKSHLIDYVMNVITRKLEEEDKFQKIQSERVKFVEWAKEKEIQLEPMHGAGCDMVDFLLYNREHVPNIGVCAHLIPIVVDYIKYGKK